MGELAEHYSDYLTRLMRRHDAALAAAELDYIIVFSGEPVSHFLDDNHYPFVVNPQFKSWLPLLDAPYSAVIYVPGERPILVHYQPQDYWHTTPQAPSGYWVEHFDIRPIDHPEGLLRHLPETPTGRRGALVAEAGVEFAGIPNIEHNPSNLINYLDYYRSVKHPYELACMRRASAIGTRAHRVAEQTFRTGGSEYDIHLAYLNAAGHTDAQLPYGNIVALNEHGATLHYQSQAQTSPPIRRSFLIDAGASYNGYACDITRTYAYESGEFSDLIDTMEQLQLAVCGEVRAGVDYRDLHVATHAKLAQVLIEHQLLSGLSVEAIVAQGISSVFLPHGLGHYLGLQVHDVGGFLADEWGETIDRPDGHPFLRLTRTLKQDEVLTIEPGLYFIGMLLEELRSSANTQHVNWERVNMFMPFGGVRIEDNVAVRRDGCENLTRDAFAAV